MRTNGIAANAPNAMRFSPRGAVVAYGKRLSRWMAALGRVTQTLQKQVLKKTFG